jgi:hypothetical protein
MFKMIPSRHVDGVLGVAYDLLLLMLASHLKITTSVLIFLHYERALCGGRAAS